MRKNDIDEIKAAIRKLIADRNREYAEGNKVSDAPLRISHDEFRKVDRMCTVDGKRQWLSKVVVAEMVAAGELEPPEGYGLGFAKRYKMTKTALAAPDDFVEPWDDKAPAISTKDHAQWLSMFYDKAELRRRDREWKARERLARLSRCGNCYIYEGEDWRRYAYGYGE